MKIAILANQSKRIVPKLQAEIITWLHDHGAEVVAPDRPYSLTGSDFIYRFLESPGNGCDAILVLGGDGTLLTVARQAACFGIPLLGVNIGRIGFLAELEPGEELFAALRRLVDGEYDLESRMMLHVRVLRKNKLLAEYHCLNDCVVTKNNQSGLLRVAVFVDDRISVSYHGDGVIVATPTGASGYSLSALGPLVSPEVEAMVVTPICAQSLYSRSMVIGAGRTICLETDVEDGGHTLAIDGHTATLPLKHNDRIEITRSDMATKLIRLNGKTFFDVLNEKLRDRR